MKKTEIILANYAAIVAAMIEHYQTVIACEGRLQYDIYIWSDGELDILEQFQGGNSYLRPVDGETRNLYYVTTVGGQLCNIWDLAWETPPEDPDELKTAEEEITAWLLDEYRNNIDDVMDRIIEDAKLEDLYDANA